MSWSKNKFFPKQWTVSIRLCKKVPCARTCAPLSLGHEWPRENYEWGRGGKERQSVRREWDPPELLGLPLLSPRPDSVDLGRPFCLFTLSLGVSVHQTESFWLKKAIYFSVTIVYRHPQESEQWQLSSLECLPSLRHSIYAHDTLFRLDANTSECLWSDCCTRKVVNNQ